MSETPSSEVKLTKREANHSFQFRAEVKNIWRNTPTPSLLTDMVLNWAERQIVFILISKCLHFEGFISLILLCNDWLIMMGWYYVSELRPPAGLLFIPRVICEYGEPWWWCRLGITPDSSTRALCQSYQQRQVGVMDEGVRIFPIQYLRYLKGSLTYRKMLRRGISGFTYHPLKGVLRIFITLKSPSLLLGLNPRPLDPVASTLTTTPPSDHAMILLFRCRLFFS
jgi:hypothetical protein